MSDSSTIATATSPLSKPCLPRLRIHHFLVWTMVMAMMLAALDWTKLLDPTQAKWMVAVAIIGHVFSSAALTCFLFGMVWRWRGLPFPSEPGHAMVIVIGLGAILNELLIMLIYSAILGDRDGIPAAHDASSWVISVVRWTGPIAGIFLALFTAIFAIWQIRDWRWSLVLALLTAILAAHAFVQTFYREIFGLFGRSNTQEVVLWVNLSTEPIPITILLLCIVLAVWKDARLGVSRHWTHWVGVTSVTFCYMLELIRHAAWYFVNNGT